MPSIGRSPKTFWAYKQGHVTFYAAHNKAVLPFTRRTISAVSAANECEGITCLWQVTRNGSDEAERSERSPPWRSPQRGR